MVKGHASTRASRAQRGVSLIEVMVALIVVAFGLFGLVGLQARLQASEMEGYQRSQALIMLNDMANRIAINRRMAASYVTSTALGSGGDCPAMGTTRQEVDTAEWCNALQGAAETDGASKMGTVIGGRGCVQDLGNNEYLVTVAWQGLLPISAPSTGVPCGKDLYNDATRCVNDLCRRTVTTLVRIGTLS
ncbi:type IV pilus assembly protein PilV [Variovorax sp. OK605]|uniref:prepilin-type N-terminal cleavage/methylation domain-containing protein n=1 Tax=Variovorax sp. OK605 TaxID=1855317 RepID=UPI0008E5C4EC|nr:prepilin-type N-terminal cleavage/methylation domain-containing protein [Variovorax sp. OK605]SFQ74488.1 type IV pilus assembly protein PilV [Variovorax sp. OK605]